MVVVAVVDGQLLQVAAIELTRAASTDPRVEIERFLAITPFAVVALPPGFFRNFNERERELALAHEIAHHKSGDLLVNLFAFGLLCLHWFNPLAWIAWRAFRFDQEAACDARVLGATIAAGEQIELLDVAGDWAWIACGPNGPSGYVRLGMLEPVRDA